MGIQEPQAFLKINPLGPGFQADQVVLLPPGLLPERNRQCFFITYFRNLFCYLQAKSGGEETSFIQVGAGGAGWLGSDLSPLNVHCTTELRAKTPTRKKAQGEPTRSSYFCVVSFTFPLQTVSHPLPLAGVTCLEGDAIEPRSPGFETRSTTSISAPQSLWDWPHVTRLLFDSAPLHVKLA